MSEAGEFQIIEQFFTYPSFGAWKSQGVGDDCAIIDTGAGRLAVTCDMTALGTHFFPDADPDASLQKEKNFQLPVPVGGEPFREPFSCPSACRVETTDGWLISPAV